MVAQRFKRRVPEARPPVIGQLRHEVVAYAADLGAGAMTREAVTLAVSEALTNVVVHAYVGGDPGEVLVEAWEDEDRHLVVLVCDAGRGMVPRTDSPGLGLGMSLMARMADDLHVADRRPDPGTMVQLRFSLDGAGGTAAEGVGELTA